MSVEVTLESCVRTLSVSSACDKCKSVCEDTAIDFDAGFVRIDSDKCTECGLCIGVCPTMAISAKELSFAALGSDELFCLALSHNTSFEIETLGACTGKVDEANAILAAYNKEIKISLTPIKDEKSVEDGSKRALFRSFTRGGIKSASQKLKSTDELASELDFGVLKNKKVPPKRELFLGVVENLSSDMDIPLSFASDKIIDDTCDNCSLCYNLCPSGALETTMMKNAILFSPHLCLRCKLCEDVCQSHSISSLPTFALSNFVERKKRVLTKFKSKLCESCGAVFSGDGDECPRCAKESEDAHELLGF
jgi:energy-converting hydrogenase A subunit P